MIERDMFIGKVLDEDLLSKIYRNAYNAAWGDLEIKYQGRIDQMEEEHEAYKADIDKQMADKKFELSQLLVAERRKGFKAGYKKGIRFDEGKIERKIEAAYFKGVKDGRNREFKDIAKTLEKTYMSGWNDCVKHHENLGSCVKEPKED